MALRLAVPALTQRASASVTPQSIDVRFEQAPSWFGGSLETYLTDIVLSCIHAEGMNRTGLVKARNLLIGTGCFSEVDQVRRANESRIEVDATFLQPYALVDDAKGPRLVDPQGALLPSFYKPGKGLHFITLTGTLFPRPNTVGATWEGSDVIAALELISILDRCRWRDQINVVDVTGLDRGRPITLQTNLGARIVWGAAPGKERPLEALSERKLSYLEHQFQRTGRVDGGQPGTLDVTSPNVMLRYTAP